MADIVKINMPQTPTWSYDVVIGQDLRNRLLDDLKNGLLPGVKRFVVVMDDTVDRIYGAKLVKYMRNKDLPVDTIVYQGGESAKSRQTKEMIEDRMIQMGYGRDTGLIAYGGGVTTDLAGFVAATYMRGIPYVAVPSSILGAADACIGGKTGVNTPAGKNLIGAFYPPHRVYIDINFWVTLPYQEVLCGMSETIKHAAIVDGEFFRFLEENIGKILPRDKTALMHLDPDICLHIARTNCEIKQKIVETDEKERGKRVVLNFGHTLGHAVEAQSQYTLPHGYAVSIGMVLEAWLACQLEALHPDEFERLRYLLHSIGLPTQIPRLMSVEDIVNRAHSDKKATDGQINYVMLDGIGYVRQFHDGRWMESIEDDTVITLLKKFQQEATKL